MKIHVLFAGVLAGVLCGAFPVNAYGATIQHNASVTLATTNWSNSFSIPQFDPSLGTLTSVTIALSGHVEGTGTYWNESATPADVTGTLKANITLTEPDTTTIVVSPSDTRTVLDIPQAFWPNLPPSYTDSGFSANAGPVSDTSTSPSYLAAFTGGGTILLPVSAVGQSTASSDQGNFVYEFETKASASVLVTYNYREIPEPSSFATFLIMSSSCGLVAIWRRRKAARKSAS